MCEKQRFCRKCAPTCQSDDIQRGAAHIVGDLYFDDVGLGLVQLREPDVLHFLRLLVKDGGEGPKLSWAKGRILRRSH